MIAWFKIKWFLLDLLTSYSRGLPVFPRKPKLLIANFGLPLFVYVCCQEWLYFKLCSELNIQLLTLLKYNSLKANWSHDMGCHIGCSSPPDARNQTPAQPSQTSQQGLLWCLLPAVTHKCVSDWVIAVTHATTSCKHTFFSYEDIKIVDFNSKYWYARYWHRSCNTYNLIVHGLHIHSLIFSTRLLLSSGSLASAGAIDYTVQSNYCVSS